MSNPGYNNGQWPSGYYPPQPGLELEDEYNTTLFNQQQQQQMGQRSTQQPSISSHSYPSFGASSSQFLSGPDSTVQQYANHHTPGQPGYNALSGPSTSTSMRSAPMTQNSYNGTSNGSQPLYNQSSAPYYGKSTSQSPQTYTNGGPSYPPQFANAAAAPSHDGGGLTPPNPASNLHLSFPHPTQLQPHSFLQQPQSPEFNTQRNSDDGAEDDQDLGHSGNDEPARKGKKGKTGSAACARCKSLKVRCELKTDDDPCKRCLNGGHECVTPNKKKRRTPPKREHLLNQIQAQASQIHQLMAQLEATNLRASTSPTTDMSSPILDAASLISPKDEVSDWLQKAKDSMDAFGGFIGAGGRGQNMTKDQLVKEDPEESESEEDDEEQIGIAVQGSDGELEGPPEGIQRRREGTPGSKLANLPPGAAPFGLIADLALKHRNRTRSDSAASPENLGVANRDFFRPNDHNAAPGKQQQQPNERIAPHILTRNVVTPEEAEQLFKIFFDYMNMSVSLLDPVLYTARHTVLRSPFLFTVICAIASRFYPVRPELYNQCMQMAQLAAGTALISGQKKVETVHAYILLALYPVPARRWEEDRSWIYLGLAIRIAIDLNLHHPNTAKPVDEWHAREMLNRNRAWLNCFNLDRSTGSQYGKSPQIKNSDYLANQSGGFWNSSPYNLENFDIHLCAYNSELKLMGDFVGKIYSDPKHPTGLNKEVDFEQISTETDEAFKRLGDRWFAKLDQTDQTEPQNCFRTGLLRLAYSYARLFVLSFGFQHAFGKSNSNENPFLLRCLRAASDVVNYFVDDIGRPSQRIYLRHGPEAQSVFVTFASAFLIKLLQPKFSSYLTVEQRLEIRRLVQKAVDLLGSHEVAIDDRHGPKLYSRFLKGLLDTPMASVDVPSPRSNHKRGKSRSMTPETSTQTLSQSQSQAQLQPQSHYDFTSIPISNGSQHASSQHLLTPQDQIGIPYEHLAPFSEGGSIGGQPPADLALDAMEMDSSTFFQAPLPYDDEFLQSMQSLSDPAWSQMALPGFNWMTQMQSSQSTPQADADFMARMNDTNMYTSNPNTYFTS